MHFLFSMPVAYRPHPLYWHVLMRLRMFKLSLGKGHQVIKLLCMQYYATVATERAGYVFYRALVILLHHGHFIAIKYIHHVFHW